MLRNCLLDSLLNYTPDFIVSSAATNLEVHKGDHDLWDYCTSEWRQRM